MLLQFGGCQEATEHADVQARERLCYCLLSCTMFRLVSGCRGPVLCCISASVQLADMYRPAQNPAMQTPQAGKHTAGPKTGSCCTAEQDSDQNSELLLGTESAIDDA